MRRAFFGGKPPLAIGSYSFDSASGVIAGTSWGGTVSWSGGVAPYTVQLLSGSVTQYQATGISAFSYTLRGTAMQGWNGGTMYLKVTDSIGATLTTGGQSISIYWITDGSVSVSSTTPAKGTFISCSMSASFNPGPSYSWQYQTKPNGGSWGSWLAFGSNSSLAYTGTFTNSGDQWLFRCTATNAAGSVTATSPTVTVGA